MWLCRPACIHVSRGEIGLGWAESRITLAMDLQEWVPFLSRSKVAVNVGGANADS